jgi:hypothetical protein
MRILTITAVITALALGTPALAQSQTPQPPDGDQAPSSQPADAIRSVAVVDIDDLPPPVRSQVDAVVAQMSVEDLQALRASIDETPLTSSALKARGLNSSQVVAANVDAEGKLTLITNSEV